MTTRSTLVSDFPKTDPLLELPELATDLRQVEFRLDTLVQSRVPEIPRIGRYLVRSGGKRLRPMLTLLAARAAHGTSAPIDLAAVGELIHLASLLHDDVVDDGELRRGQRTANRVYGNGVVVLVGDFCLASALRTCTIAGPPHAVTSLAEAVTEMAEGEVLQLQNIGRLDLPVDDYFTVIEKKSAALLAWCCTAGALSAGAAQDQVDALNRFGRALGIAFQIADDVLDYAGTPAETGKALATDLRGLKVTLPLLIAVQRAPNLGEQLAVAFTKEVDDETLGNLAYKVVECGAVDEARERARQWIATAIATLDDHRLEPQAVRSMIQLAQIIVDRRN